MGQVLHGCTTTTEAVRRALQRNEASVRALAERYGISPTTVQKWRRRAAGTALIVMREGSSPSGRDRRSLAWGR
jgi:transposase-like protein